MDKIKYLEEHHHITQSIIGLVSIQTTIEGVKEVLDKWKPQLNDLSVQRYMAVCAEQGIEWEEVKDMFTFTKEGNK